MDRLPVRLVRFLASYILLFWLGCVLTTTFFTARSLFANESGLTPTSDAAGTVVGPLLHKMYLTGWIALPATIALLGVLWKLTAARHTRAILIASAMLGIAWAGGLYAGGPLTGRIQELRVEIKKEFGSVQAAPRENPNRREFGKLHGISMMLVLVDIIMGTGAFFCVTQLTGPGGGNGSPSPREGD